MATAAKHDVPLTLSVDTVGLESIKQLKSDIAALGKEGASATPEFAKLAAEIDKLADQSKLVTSFGQLTDEVEQLAVAQSQAGQRAKEVASDLDTQRQATDKLRVTERGFKDELVAAQRALFDKRQALASLKNTTKDYADEARVMTAAIIEAKTEVRNLADAHKVAKAETSEAALAEGKLAIQLKTLTSVSDAATTKLSERNSALRDTKAALEAAGGATADYATAEAALGAAFTALTTKVQENRQALVQSKVAAEEMADADRLLAIEQRGLAELFEKGRVALIAEETAFREAARSSAAYSAAREAESAARVKAAALWQKEADAIVENAEAKARNLQETKRLIEAQNFLAAEAANDKWQKQAFAIVEAAEAATKLRIASERLAEAERFMANEAILAAAALGKIDNAAKEAGDGIANALGTVGVRSAAEIRIEIDKVKTALNLLQSSGTLVGNELDAAFAKGASKIKGLERDLREATGQMTMADKATRAFSGAMGQLTVANLASEAIMGVVQRVQDMGRAFLDAVVQGDQMRRGLNAIYKDADLTAKQIDFLRKTASESGVAIGGLGGDFVRFSASMKSANIPIEQSNQLFRSLTAASSSLGLGTEATAGALNALSQMASKGVVSMEELRQQLGDRLPGALGLTATAMNITEAELISLVESGSLATRDFIGPFTKGLETMRGEVDGLVPAWDRFKNVLTQTSQGVGDAGFIILLTGALKVLGGTVGAVALGLSTMFEALFLVGSGVTAVAARLSGDTKAWEFFADQVEKSRVRLTGQAEAFNNFLEPAAAAANATTAVGNASAATAAQIKVATDAQDAMGVSSSLSAEAAKLNSDATLNLADNLVKYNTVAAEKIKAQAIETEGLGKLAKAAKDQGDQMVTLAKLSGDAAVLTKAEADASALHAAALDKVVVSQKAEVDLLLTQRQHIIDVAKARGDNAEQIKTQTAELDKKVAKAAPELQQMVDAAKAAQAEAFARQLTVAALKDHSAEVSKLKAAMDLAAVTLKEYERLAINGKKTEEEVLAARRSLTQATVLYKDSLTDLIAKTELDTKVKSANIQLQIAQVQGSQNHYTALANEARALGDTEKAARLDIKAKEESLRVMRLKLELAKLEQDAALIEIDLKKKTIDGTTEEGKAKLKLLDIETQMIKIKQVGNQAAQDAIKALEVEIKKSKDSMSDLGKAGKDAGNEIAGGMNGAASATSGLTSAVSKTVQAYRDLAGAMYEATSAAGKLNMERAKAAVDDGQFLVAGNETTNAKRLDNMDASAKSRAKTAANVETGGSYLTILGAYNEAKSAGVPEADALRIAKEYGIDPAAPISGSMVKKWDPRRFQIAVSEASMSAKQNAVNLADPTSLAYKSAIDKTGQPPSAGAAPANIVNVNIGGVSTAINVNSQTDANNLQNVLRQLASAQGRSI